MNRYYLEITCQVRGVSRDRMGEVFNTVADAVYDLEHVIDADLGANLQDGLFDFTMEVDADDEVGALSAGLGAVRTAIHASGGATPGWEDHFEQVKQVITREPELA